MTLQLRFNPFTGTLDYVDIAAASGVTTPVLMTADFTIPANSQVLFREPITVGSFRVIGGAGSYLMGV